MADTFQFPDFSVTQNPSETLIKARYFGGTAAEDSLSLAVDLTAIDGVTNLNGNLSWQESDGTVIAVNSEVDYLTTTDHYYMNLNTSRSADVAFVMNARSRAVISNEWLEAFTNGDLTVSYENAVGAASIDTIIGSDHGQVIFADYDLRENLENLETIQFLGGGIVLDFGIAA